jgi:hypothetical protein
MQRYNPKKLNNVEVKEKYQVKILSRFAALEIFDDEDEDVSISRAWKSIRENMKASDTESLERPKLLDEREQVKLQ